MSIHQSPPFRRRVLGRRFRELRVSAGMTAAEVARRVEISTGRLSRIENGEVAPDIPVAKCLLDLYLIPVNEWEPYLDWVRAVRREKGWWREFGVSRTKYLHLETAASSYQCFQLAQVPGLLQTPDYARALFRECMIDRSPGAVERGVSTRAFRQRRLTCVDDPLHVDVLLDHAVLARLAAGGPIGHGQLRWIAEVAELPTVRVRIVPLTAWLHSGLDGAFTILGFPGGEPDVAFVESPGGEFVVEEARTYHDAFDKIANSALDQAESVGYIRRMEPVSVVGR